MRQHKNKRVAAGLIIALVTIAGAFWYKRRAINRAKNQTRGSFFALVGNTPLFKIKSLSDALGVQVYGKAEFLNPGGSVKDRVAVEIIKQGEAEGVLGVNPNSRIVEGTSGSTGVSLALAANACGYKATIFIPNDISQEKKNTLKTIGAEVKETPTVAISDPRHYVNAARKAAKLSSGSYFADQFDCQANFNAHYYGTAEEIWSQAQGNVQGFVASCGTGGTVAGCAARLKEHNPYIKIVVGDPQGSGVANAVRKGLMYNERDSEGKRKRVYSDTIVEGIGLNRMTGNFKKALPNIDYAYTVTDEEAARMAKWLIKHDGLFCGSSSAINCCALVRAVQQGVFHPGDKVVIILCDSGQRHLSRFYNDKVLRNIGENVECPSTLEGCLN